MKMNKKGFTLVEMLAVIAIIALIMLVTVNILINQFTKVKEELSKGQIDLIYTAASSYVNDNINDYPKIVGTEYCLTLDILIKGGYLSDNLVDAINDSEIDKSLGVKIIVESNNGYEYDFNSTTSSCKYVLRPGADGASVPTLTDNLVAVEISDTGVVTVADTSNTNWYNYNESKWANAVIMEGTAPAAGQTISMDDIKQMYVWIPRYKYSNITTADKPITIEFVDKTVTEGVHPAFSLEGTGEISGIWVGKFEMAEDYKIIPNVNSLHGANVSTMFNGIKALNTGGSDNIHLLKNTEWGAAAYLSQSKYGICTETECSSKVQNNNYYDSSSYDITTGCGGNDTAQNVSGGICPDTNIWTTDNGKGASTTHNITGIYDMAGGRFEYVMGVQYDSAAKENLTVCLSGFSQDTLNELSSKLVDKYDYGTSSNDTNRNILGDATVETIDWNGDFSYFVYSSNPWFIRGGHANQGSRAGLWYFAHNSGDAYGNYSARASVFGQ